MIGIIGGKTSPDSATLQKVYSLILEAEQNEWGIAIVDSPINPLELHVIYHAAGRVPVTLYARRAVDMLQRSYVDEAVYPKGVDQWTLSELAERVGQAARRVVIFDDGASPVTSALAEALRLHTVVEVIPYG